MFQLPKDKDEKDIENQIKNIKKQNYIQTSQINKKHRANSISETNKDFLNLIVKNTNCLPIPNIKYVSK